MASFIIAAFLLLVLVLVLLLRPLIFKRNTEGVSRRQMNAVIYREELDKLAAEHAAGLMNSEEYEMSHAEMRQRLFQDVSEEDDRSVMGSPKKTAIALCILISFFSCGLYFYLGDALRVAQNNQERPVTQEGVEKMVAQFAAKMEKDPSNLQGWAMLARSYRIMGRNADAAKAYGRAGSFVDSDPELLAEFADVLASNANGSFAGKPLQLIGQALKLDPNNLLALWLSGTASFNDGDYKKAVQTWEKLAKQLPPNSDEARAIKGSIDQARSKSGITNPIASIKRISGTIEIAPNLQSKIRPGDTVMVIARQAGERMPIAVLKTTVTSFPMRFELDDALAMNPSMPLSQFEQLTVEARITKSGMAKPEVGDLISVVKTVKVGANSVRLLVDQVRQ
ncbi:c-type cytochrome biogenesis protein CcmI [Polynucleobacter necessarius]|uniref:c-type cytochrome biogenesis protein CcmI n=1 Tax=Polynucleobacter necessarius TaxID=576610 RepID=UPI000E099DAC|nr:c-type cytochrome biogenesis protein CcmI [Polynucleobacter necessarius]